MPDFPVFDHTARKSHVHESRAQESAKQRKRLAARTTAVDLQQAGVAAEIAPPLETTLIAINTAGIKNKSYKHQQLRWCTDDHQAAHNLPAAGIMS